MIAQLMIFFVFFVIGVVVGAVLIIVSLFGGKFRNGK